MPAEEPVVDSAALGGAPGRALLWTDYARSLADFGALMLTWPILSRAPRGDGHPVLVLPGLVAPDASTIVLRVVLRRLGYTPYGWNLGTNLGPTHKIVDGTPARLDQIGARHKQPVTLIGWSLGGIFARQLSRNTPDSVRRVITLGSPFKLASDRHSHARFIYNLWRKRHVTELLAPLEAGLGALPVPATSIYSRRDGIVSWRACLDGDSPHAENIEVTASHVGLGHHPAVLYAIADRLGQAHGQWQPFHPPRWLRCAYPDARRD
jgi:pimeloyl-ACP methyl ester carboxylesterase